jgi:cob(I)alamin adenosyltransferase
MLMGHRLSKIYTRTGDDGTTGLANGERIDKADARLNAFGDVDEANSALGSLLAEPDVPPAMREIFTRIQHELFEIGAELSLPGYRAITAGHISRLERDLDGLNADLPPLKEFVLPGGAHAAAVCHLARTICRRAERSAWAAGKLAPLNQDLTSYLNRLSDLLFVAARCLARQGGGQETLWQR